MESFMAICACADVRVSGRDATQGSKRRKTASRRPRAPNRFWGRFWTARSSEMHGRPYDAAAANAGRRPGSLGAGRRRRALSAFYGSQGCSMLPFFSLEPLMTRRKVRSRFLRHWG